MKFALKFVQTPELKEFYDEMRVLIDSIYDTETLFEGAQFVFCIIALYFITVIIAF